MKKTILLVDDEIDILDIQNAIPYRQVMMF